MSIGRIEILNGYKYFIKKKLDKKINDRYTFQIFGNYIQTLISIRVD